MASTSASVPPHGPMDKDDVRDLSDVVLQVLLLDGLPGPTSAAKAKADADHDRHGVLCVALRMLRHLLAHVPTEVQKDISGDGLLMKLAWKPVVTSRDIDGLVENGPKGSTVAEVLASDDLAPLWSHESMLLCLPQAWHRPSDKGGFGMPWRSVAAKRVGVTSQGGQDLLLCPNFPLFLRVEKEFEQHEPIETTVTLVNTIYSLAPPGSNGLVGNLENQLYRLMAYVALTKEVTQADLMLCPLRLKAPASVMADDTKARLLIYAKVDMNEEKRLQPPPPLWETELAGSRFRLSPSPPRHMQRMPVPSKKHDVGDEGEYEAASHLTLN
ncbi:hypothetical protein PG984_008148 [Apiospora sp. TS-2023a]